MGMAKRSSYSPVLGIDIGRVIIGAADPSGRADTSFLSASEEEALGTPATDGAFEAIAELVRAFEGRVWLVSKCGPRIQRLTRQWLLRHDFYGRTGVRADRIRFCRKRPEKRDHCAAIAATHFIDDRLDVLQHLVGLVTHLYWFGHQRADAPVPRWARVTVDWAEAQQAILSGLRSPDAETAPARGS
jgi:hypothetical protein